MNGFFFSISLLCAILLIQCKNGPSQGENQVAMAADSLSAQSNATSNAPLGDIKELANLTGKNPSDVAMFTKYLPDSRMKALLGVEFPDFKLDWNDASTIEKDAELVYFSGCRKDACSDNTYLVIVDLTGNQVNVMNFKGEAVRTYEEGGVIIGLTDKLAEEVKRLRKKK